MTSTIHPVAQARNLGVLTLFFTLYSVQSIVKSYSTSKVYSGSYSDSFTYTVITRIWALTPLAWAVWIAWMVYILPLLSSYVVCFPHSSQSHWEYKLELIDLLLKVQKNRPIPLLTAPWIQLNASQGCYLSDFIYFLLILYTGFLFVCRLLEAY